MPNNPIQRILEEFDNRFSSNHFEWHEDILGNRNFLRSSLKSLIEEIEGWNEGTRTDVGKMIHPDEQGIAYLRHANALADYLKTLKEYL